LIPLEFGVATAMTAVSIGGIVTTYLSVLKRNGWIGNMANSKSQIISKAEPTKSAAENEASTKTEENKKLKRIKEAKSDNAEEELAPKETANAENKVVLKKKLAKTLIEAQKSSETYEVPRKCNHHFGYLSSMQKDAEIPDECYTCSKLIQCFQEPKK